jgi:hypothetical protein
VCLRSRVWNAQGGLPVSAWAPGALLDLFQRCEGCIERRIGALPVVGAMVGAMRLSALSSNVTEGLCRRANVLLGRAYSEPV